LYAAYNIIQSYLSSLFFAEPDRLNLVFYGKNTSFYSIDVKEDRHYFMNFPPDLKIDTPGGYGKYRIGSIGKLIELEKNYEILKKSFSLISSSFVSYYFINSKDEIFYGLESSTELLKPTIADLLFSQRNSSFFDTLYILMLFSIKKDSDFVNISYTKKMDSALGKVDFSGDSFFKNSLGLFYQQVYRTEKQSIQIKYYESRKTAVNLSNIIEGNGIRVSNISKSMKKQIGDSCVVIYSSSNKNETAMDMANFFECTLVNGKTGIYDIVFEFNNDFEKKWEII